MGFGRRLGTSQTRSINNRKQLERKLMRKIFKIALWTVLGLLLIQLIPIDRTNPPVNEKDNFVRMENTPKEVEVLLKKLVTTAILTKLNTLAMPTLHLYLGA